MDVKQSPLDGAHMLDGPVTVVDVWQMLHSNAQEWHQVPRDANHYKVKDLLDQADTTAFRKLREFPVDYWEQLCAGAGWTLTGVVGLSWCQNASLDLVAHYWKKAIPVTVPNASTMRAASFFRKRLLPEETSVLEVIQKLQDDFTKIAIVLVTRHSELVFDVPTDLLANAPKELQPLIMHLLANRQDDPELAAIFERWKSEEEERSNT
ncbi:MAG: hypothetical protein AAGL89_16485 [Pseudomonadota bacterium]